MPSKAKLRELTILNQTVKEYEEELKSLKEQLEKCKEEVYQQFIDEGVGSVGVINENSEKVATVFIRKMRFPAVQDPEKFGAFIKQHGLQHLFTINPMALMGFVNNELAGIDPAADTHLESIGLTAFDKSTVQIRRA